MSIAKCVRRSCTSRLYREVVCNKPPTSSLDFSTIRTVLERPILGSYQEMALIVLKERKLLNLSIRGLSFSTSDKKMQIYHKA
jgi:hypothetical protein